jgi:hypothetical protein
MTFDELAASRREWIETVLKPWCAAAPRIDLMKAHADWADIAGRVDPEKTLWAWAWSRFPDLVHEEIAGVNETFEVTVTLRDGTTATGYPDGRLSRLGSLVLLCQEASGHYSAESGPHSIDDIAGVTRV